MKRVVMLFIIASVVLTSCTTRGKYAAMRCGLDSINQCNRNDLPFTVQDVEPYVNFFDKHGKPNDQLLAHYLLGRAYYESHEAPMALQCYHEAIECADTAQKDCDFKQLSRVYAQMAQIFYDQGLYRQQLESDKQAEEFAWIAKDTLAALISNEKQGVAYSEIKMLDSAVCVIDNVASKFSQYGYTTHATISLGNILHILINLGEYEKARRYISIYESRSGYINKNKDAIEGKEFYYYCKGRLSIVSTQLDSAEYWFRKELEYGKDFNNQNAGALGLAMVYEQRHIPDSAAKYYHYAYAMNDSMHAQKATEEVERMQAMYDYTRHQEAARREEKKATFRAQIIWICIGLIILLCIVGYIIYEESARKRKDIEQKYLSSLDIIMQARQDIAKLEAHKIENSELIAEKKQLIHKQKDYLKTLSEESIIYKQFLIKGQEPTLQELDQIKEQVFELFPDFCSFMSTHEKMLNDKEYKTCILVRAGFNPKSISNMLGVGPSYISNIRSEMLQKLFGKAGTPKDFDKLLRNIC